MAAGLAWCTAAAILDHFTGPGTVLVAIQVVGPVLAAAYAGPRRTAVVAVYAVGIAVALGAMHDIVDSLSFALRMTTVVVGSGVAVWVAAIRERRERELTAAEQGERQERRLRQAYEARDRLHELAASLRETSTPTEVARAAFAVARNRLGATAGAFGAATDGGGVRFLDTFGFRPDARGGRERATATDGPYVEVLATSRSRLDEVTEPAGTLAGDPPTSEPARTRVILPLVVSGTAAGVLGLWWEDAAPLDEGTREILPALADQCAQALERARLTEIELADLARARELEELSLAMAGVLEVDEAAALVVARGCAALGAVGGAVSVPDDEGGLRRVAADGPVLDDVVPRELHAVLTGHADGRRARGSGLFLADSHQLRARFPAVPDGFAHEVQAVAVLPLVGRGGLLGSISFSFPTPHAFPDAERRFLTTLAAQCSQTLHRARLFDAERLARERLTVLSELTDVLGSSLDPAAVLRRLVDVVVNRLADACVVLVPGPDGLERQVLAGNEEVGPQLAARLGEHPVPFDSDAPAAIAYRTATPQLVDLTSAVLQAAGLQHEEHPALRTIRSAMAVPLMARGEVIGIMAFLAGPQRHRFGPDDVAFALEVAGRAGPALDNATRYQRERGVSEILQRAVLPDRLPQVEGFSLDAEYRPGATGSYAGGDWFDAVELTDGRLLVTVGDVMGKGASAAALMGQVRSAIRAYGVIDPVPASILRRIDRLFEILGEDRLVTLVVGILDPRSGEFEFSSAGHPDPLLVEADGAARFLPHARSRLIGAGLEESAARRRGRLAMPGLPVRPQHRIVLAPGDTVVLYSDGLVEHRDEPMTAGLERLRLAASQSVSRRAGHAGPPRRDGDAGAVRGGGHADAVRGDGHADAVRRDGDASAGRDGEHSALLRDADDSAASGDGDDKAVGRDGDDRAVGRDGEDEAVGRDGDDRAARDPGPVSATALADRLTESRAVTDDIVVLTLYRRGSARADHTIAPQPIEDARPPRLTEPLVLAPDLRSVPTARAWTAEILATVPDGQRRAALQLVSEVVTNAVLHAGTAITLMVRRQGDDVLVEVADGSPTFPSRRRFSPDATTGRGLLLLDSLAGSWGTERRGGGKIVWFTVPSVPGRRDGRTDGARGRGSWVRRRRRRRGSGSDAGHDVEVALLGGPARELVTTFERYDALAREMRLARTGAARLDGSPPAALAEAVEESSAALSPLVTELRARWEAAVEAGSEIVDVRLQVPADTGLRCVEADRVLDEADAYCRAAELLTVPPRPDEVALRKWVLLGVAEQCAGGDPVPWTARSRPG
jgi:GAF domain-containing protein/anti-sigma regulatory factor (Ser/Thr protein kinase)